MSGVGIGEDIYDKLLDFTGMEGISSLATDFNDLEETTKEDVLNLLTKGAKYYRNKGE